MLEDAERAGPSTNVLPKVLEDAESAKPSTNVLQQDTHEFVEFETMIEQLGSRIAEERSRDIDAESPQNIELPLITPTANEPPQSNEPGVFTSGTETLSWETRDEEERTKQLKIAEN
ncbi:hypothetical protein DKX38_024540 [Salix brachista]|uniref:Uncharacterized protein n=1 Tax=Salix brachista TaxID=2182728 RepID=A0A5N5JLK0_9ROSI|nr:hypothetical protein DKX38_024540 [Salix brachista]